MSRIQREGRYVGRWRYKHVRRKKDMPAWEQDGEIIFDAYAPFVDSSIAWVTFHERSPDKATDFKRSKRYMSKADRIKYGL